MRAFELLVQRYQERVLANCRYLTRSPADAEDLTDGWRPGQRLFRSWLLVGGLLPVDYDDVSFAEVEPGRRFLERSSLLSQSVWEHERTIEPVRIHFYRARG